MKRFQSSRAGVELMPNFTIDDIEDAWLREKTARGLTDLSDEFYSNVASYVAELRSEIERSRELRRELLESELKRTLEMVHEIHLLRVLKAMDETIGARTPSPLSERERHTFDEIRQSLEKLHTDLAAPIVKERATPASPREIRNMVLLIQADIPQIMSDNLRRYGPFKEGEVANLPKRSAKLLTKRGLAREIGIKNIKIRLGKD